MSQLISEIWEGLRDAGLPEVMLYLPDQSASRCHWKDTTMIGEVRVALLADQDRQIVRILPIDSCEGIGIASPKGVDPSGYKTFVFKRLRARFGGEGEDATTEPETEEETAEPEPTFDANAATVNYLQPVAAAPPAPPEPPAPDPAAKPDTLASRWGVTPRAGNARTGTYPPVRRPGH